MKDSAAHDTIDTFKHTHTGSSELLLERPQFLSYVFVCLFTSVISCVDTFTKVVLFYRSFIPISGEAQSR